MPAPIVLFHVLALRGAVTDVPERVALSIILLLLTIIGGGNPHPRLPTNTWQRSTSPRGPHPFRVSMACRCSWSSSPPWRGSLVQPEGQAAGALFVAAGVANLIRVSRWRGWVGWREPLVVILTVGYGWVALSLLALGGAILGVLPAANAVHVLTSGAVGTMTLAVMTRASLGHTGRTRHAGPMTVVIYVLVNLGAVLRVVAPASDAPTALTNLLLGMAAFGWSGAYLLFALIYGPILVRPSLDE